MTGSKLGKEYVKALYCHPYLIPMLSTSCGMPGWMNHKLESRLLGEISATSDMKMIAPYGRKRRRIKESLDESEKRRVKFDFKVNIQKAKIMAFVPSPHGKQMGKQQKQ